MKWNRLIAIWVCLALAFACAAPALAQGDGYYEDLEDAQGEGKAYNVAVATEQNFSTLYDARFTAKWSDENGLTIYTGESGYIPYLLVYRDMGTGFHPERYFDEVLTPEFEAQYGENLIDTGRFQEYTVSGKTMPGRMYVYRIPDADATIEFLRVFDILEDSDVMYTAKYIQGQGEDTLMALAEAAAYYQSDADFYTQTAPPADVTGVDGMGDYSVEAAAPIVPGLVKYDGGYFTIDLPEGWQIQTMGQYSAFSFRAWNPENPDYEIFYYGTLTPFNKSEEAKAWNQGNAGYGFPYDYFGDAPVVAPDGVEDLFYAWNDIAWFTAKYAGSIYPANISFPTIYNLAVLETLPIDTYYADVASAEKVIRASLQTERRTNCFGKFCASLIDLGAYVMDGVDMSPLSAVGVSGVIAPQETFVEVEQILTQAIYSLNFTEAYVNEANEYARKTGEIAMANNKALQATYDGYNASWRARQTSYDIISQKNSDATLGYDRLYDPDTGEVYRAEVGFYDSYDANRNQFENPNLQIVDDGSERYYLENVQYYIHD